MPPFEKIQEYVNSVCEQIRWKKAHPIVSEEIRNHLLDQTDAYMAEGADEITAAQKAIMQMGDPVTVGAQFDRTHRPKPQWDMIILTAALVVLGLVIKIFIIGDIDRPLFFAAVGLILMTAAYFIDFTLIGRFPIATFFSIFVLADAALVLSPIVNGGRIYANIMAPLLFPLGFAAVVYAARNRGYVGLIICQLALCILSWFTIQVPTATGLILTVVSGLVILTMAIYKKWYKVKKLYGYLFAFIPLVFFVLMVLAYSPQYYWLRLKTALNPLLDPDGMGYLGTVIRRMLDGSVMFGPGQMPAEYAAQPLPAYSSYTDYLLTTLTFNFGWIAFIFIMGLLLFFIVRGFIHSFKQKSVLGSLVSLSVMLTFTLQVLSYVLANLGIQLGAPISLPLLSYGNMATVINLALIGIMLSVFRTGDMVKDKSSNVIREDDIFTWNFGKLTISYGKK